MENSYLVQRLEKPYNGEVKTPLQKISSYGFSATGLSEKAREAIRTFCRFDYMGSSEFEFGTIPKAFKMMADNMSKLVSETIRVDYEYKGWSDVENEAGTASIYIIAQKEQMEEAKNRIKWWAKNSYNDKEHYTKEMVNLNCSLAGGYKKEVVGWFELDNGYMFFKDYEMYQRFQKLFGLK